MCVCLYLYMCMCMFTLVDEQARVWVNECVSELLSSLGL